MSIEIPGMYFVVRRVNGAMYLDADERWTDYALNAWHYRSTIAFHDAKREGGDVYLRFPSGAEIRVTPEMFGLGDDPIIEVKP